MKSFLYIVSSGIGFMIGKSSDVYRRFAVIDTHSPIDLQLFRVYKIERNGYHEKRIQKMFSSKHIRAGWFDLNLEDIEEIDKYMVKNKGVRTLDNMKKVRKSLEPKKQDLSENESLSLTEDIEELEDVVEKLKNALSGRTQ